MSNRLVEDFLMMADEKRITNDKKSGKKSIYQDVLLINFIKSIQTRQKRHNRKRRRTLPEISKTEMAKRMKKIDEEMKEWKIKDEKIKEPPLKELAEPKIEKQEVKKISETSMAEEESEDVWEDFREDFEEPAEKKAHSPFYNIFMSVVSFFHF